MNKVAETSSTLRNRFVSLSNSLLIGLLVLFIFVPPFIFKKNLYDFANLPQSAFIQTGADIILLLWILKIVLEKNFKILWTPFYIPLLGLIFWSALSITWAYNKYEAIVTLKHWAACAIFFFVIVNSIRKPPEALLIGIGLFFSGFLISMIGISQHLFNLTWIPQTVPPAATFAHKNMAVEFIILTVPLGTCLFVMTKKNSVAWLTALATSFMLVFPVYSRTRSGWIALLFQFLTLFSFILINHYYHQEKLLWNKQKTFSAFVALSAFLIMANVTPKGLEWKFTEIYNRGISIYDSHKLFDVQGLGNPGVSVNSLPVEKEAASNQLQSVRIRLAMWRNTIELIREHLFTGVGLGNFQIYYPLYHQRIVNDPNFTEKIQETRTHNDYLQMAAELGFGGIIFLISFGYLILRGFLRLMRLLNDSTIRYLVLSIGMAIAGILIDAFFSFPFQRAIPPLVLMAYVGVLEALSVHMPEYNGFPISATISSAKLPKQRSFHSFAVQPWVFYISAFMVMILLICTARLEYRSIISDKYFYRSVLAEGAPDWTSVIDEGKKAYSFNPDQKRVLSVIGRGYIELGHADAAIEPLSEVINYYPNMLNPILNLGIAYEKLGKFDKAIQCFKRVITIKRDYPKAYAHMGKVYLELKEIDDAYESFAFAARYDPQNYVHYYNFGIAALLKKDYSQAKRAFESSLNLNPNLDVAHKNLGLLLIEHFDNVSLGVKHLERALEINPHIEGGDNLRKIVLKHG